MTNHELNEKVVAACGGKCLGKLALNQDVPMFVHMVTLKRWSAAERIEDAMELLFQLPEGWVWWTSYEDVVVEFVVGGDTVTEQYNGRLGQLPRAIAKAFVVVMEAKVR